MSVQREYKLMLHPTPFYTGCRHANLERYWRDCLNPAVERTPGADWGGRSFQRDQDRDIRFYDQLGGRTALLRGAGYVLRERVKLREEPRPQDRQVTLKYRHRDYGRVALKDLSGLAANKPKTKIEADIGVRHDGCGRPRPLRCRYAHSTNQDLDEALALDRLSQPMALFPGLSKGLQEERQPADPGARLDLVSGLEVRERLFEGPEARLAGAKVGFSLALWFDRRADPELTAPLLAELSYKLTPKDLEKGVSAIDAAERLFTNLQDPEFFNPASMTKTAFVYAYANRPQPLQGAASGHGSPSLLARSA